MSGNSSLYRPEIDGLRALSVVAVVLFHCNVVFPGGFVGVDVFFVISGYLITRLLLKRIDQDKFSFGDFWERRIRRILPPLAVVLIPVLVIGAIILLPADFEELGESTIAQVLLSANIFFWQQGGYFAGPSELKPLLHTWSLAVEEQFYLFFPIVLYVVVTRSKKAILPILLIGFAGSLAANLILVSKASSATFYLLPARAWELLGGSLIATNSIDSMIRSKRILKESFSAAGLLMIFYACFAFNAQTEFPGKAALIPVVGAMLFILGNTGELTLTGKLLALKPFVGIGLVSYSLYLWHWPILAFLRYTVNTPSAALLLAGCFASLILAILSYYLVEQPFRKKKVFATRVSLFKGTLGYVAALVVVGLTITQFGGLPSRFTPTELAIFEDATHSGEEYQTTTTYLRQHGFKEIGNKTKTEFDFLVIGDSHAMAVIHVFDQMAKKHDLRGAVATNNTTIPLPSVWSSRKEQSGRITSAWNDEVERLRQADAIENVILVAAWNCYLKGWTNEQLMENPRLSKSRGYATNQAGVSDEEVAFQAVENAFREYAGRAAKNDFRVWVFRQAPEAVETEIARKFSRVKLFGFLNNKIEQDGRSLSSHNVRAKNETEILANFDKSPNVSVVDLSTWFFGNETVAKHYLESAVYRDIGHVTKSGASYFYTKPVDTVLNSIAAQRKTNY